jgi:hypothetical protein
VSYAFLHALHGYRTGALPREAKGGQPYRVDLREITFSVGAKVFGCMAQVFIPEEFGKERQETNLTQDPGGEYTLGRSQTSNALGVPVLGHQHHHGVKECLFS